MIELDEFFEDMVHRGLIDDFVACFAQFLDDTHHGGVDSGTWLNPIAFDVPAKVALVVADDGVVVGGRAMWVAVMTLLGSVDKGFDDGRRRCEVHVGSAEAQQIRVATAFMLVFPLHAAEVGTVNGGVEIKHDDILVVLKRFLRSVAQLEVSKYHCAAVIRLWYDTAWVGRDCT